MQMFCLEVTALFMAIIHHFILLTGYRPATLRSTLLILLLSTFSKTHLLQPFMVLREQMGLSSLLQKKARKVKHLSTSTLSLVLVVNLTIAIAWLAKNTSITDASFTELQMVPIRKIYRRFSLTLTFLMLTIKGNGLIG